jgi:hypothetical protein
MSRIRDITNQKFGRLLVLLPTQERKRGSVVWKCRCDCGKILNVSVKYMQEGNVKSCGCLQRENYRKGTSFKHGMSNTVEYHAYVQARYRCCNSRCRNYKNYGGRGIEFRFVSFEEFYACIGPRPSSEYSLDRIDVNEHYEIGNVQWATDKEQVENRRIKRIENFSEEEFAAEATRRGYIKMELK